MLVCPYTILVLIAMNWVDRPPPFYDTNSELTLYGHMLGIKNSCKLKLGQVCNSQQESNLTWGWRFTYLLYHMNYSLLVPCCYLVDRQEKRFSLLPCAKNTKLYTEFMGSEKNGNSLNEMKILVVFLEMFFSRDVSTK